SRRHACGIYHTKNLEPQYEEQILLSKEYENSIQKIGSILHPAIQTKQRLTAHCGNRHYLYHVSFCACGDADYGQGKRRSFCSHFSEYRLIEHRNFQAKSLDNSHLWLGARRFFRLVYEYDLAVLLCLGAANARGL